MTGNKKHARKEAKSNRKIEKKIRTRMQRALGARKETKNLQQLHLFCKILNLPASTEIVENTRAPPACRPLPESQEQDKRGRRAMKCDNVTFLTRWSPSSPPPPPSVSGPWSLRGGGLGRWGRGQWGLQTGLHLLQDEGRGEGHGLRQLVLQGFKWGQLHPCE